MKLEILPYVGVSQLEFGLSRERIGEILGPPDQVEKERAGGTRELRRQNDLHAVYGDGERGLVELGFGPSIRQLEFAGVKLFEVDEAVALATVRKFGGPAHERLGFLVFLEAGITMTGFHDGAHEQLAVTVFERGRWDDMKPKLKAYPFRQ